MDSKRKRNGKKWIAQQRRRREQEDERRAAAGVWKDITSPEVWEDIIESQLGKLPKGGYEQAMTDYGNIPNNGEQIKTHGWINNAGDLEVLSIGGRVVQVRGKGSPWLTVLEYNKWLNEHAVGVEVKGYQEWLENKYSEGVEVQSYEDWKNERVGKWNEEWLESRQQGHNEHLEKQTPAKLTPQKMTPAKNEVVKNGFLENGLWLDPVFDELKVGDMILVQNIWQVCKEVKEDGTGVWENTGIPKSE